MARIVHPVCHVDAQPCRHGLAEFGPNPVGVLPSLDPHTYPVLTGPSAFLPTEIGHRTVEGKAPVFEMGPAPYDSAVFKRELEPVALPFPEPVCTTRDGHPLPSLPAPVSKLQRDVEALGWATLVQHAQGHVPHATHGRPGAAAKPCWAVRMRSGSRSAVAVRTGAAWEFFYVWSEAAGFARFTTLGGFMEALE